ncbi:putative acetyltransferase [Pedococcus cremeus]|uniref:Putative acetyltransferase n=1 Tax=Pedococcus cremeus TaxID=587636 RepID=A0A1H9XUQ5_9MICO|nr:N-acetyltransferase [Pedococcus cremeus]SES49799.1 putative acetyltransferase [Pedococcus cremeus]
MLIRRETSDDVPAIRAVTAAAFATAPHSAPPVEPDGAPGEATLVGWLRADPGWVPELSMVAEVEGQVAGHVVCTRGTVDGSPVLGLGPLSVDPAHQGSGVGSALMHAVLGAADALGEPLVALLGDPGYYRRFGFRPASEVGITAPEPAWGDLFQVRTLAAYDPALTGTFTYAAPFSRF